MAIVAAGAQTKNNSASKKSVSSPAAKPATKPAYQYLVTKANSGFGYMIFADGNLYINQSAIPGMPGDKGFADTATAGKCARLVISKLQKGIMPPTVDSTELKNL